MPVKRRRTTTSKAPSAASIAAAVRRQENLARARRRRAYYRKKWPSSKYATVHVPRQLDVAYDPSNPRNPLYQWVGKSYESASDDQKAYRKAIGYRGRGAYSLGQAWRATVGKQAGRQLRDALVGKALGAIQGSGLYGGRGLYSGRGEYNNLIEGGRDSMDIGSPNDETQTIVISHCEYLQDIFGAPSTAFRVESWSLNPGLMENFPWLSQIAQNYEEYEFVQLLFHYKSTVDVQATSNNNGATGTIIMATNYNASAPNFPNKETMMQYHGAQSGRVVDDHTHGVECDPDKNAGTAQKYVRTLPVKALQDINTYDLGKFQLAQTNVPTPFQNVQIGELWVTYTVKLTKPRVHVTLGGAIQECRWVSKGGEALGSLMGTNPLSMLQNALPIQMAQTSPNGGGVTLTFPDFCTGVFECQFAVEGSYFATSTAQGWGLSFGGAVEFFNDQLAWANANDDTPSGFYFQSSTGTNYINGGGGTSSKYLFICRIRVNPTTNGQDNTVAWTSYLTNPNAAPAAVITQCAVTVKQVSPFYAQSELSVLPTYINSQGVPTIPY